MLSPPLWALNAVDLARLIRQREVSPVEVTRCVLDRMHALNPRLNAFVAVDPERALAAAREAERLAGAEASGVLHGVPVSIKDTYWVRGFRNTMGSSLLAEFSPGEHAPAVERLVAAGAIVLGKTNTPEFGWRGSTDNPLFGETLNPWSPSLTPGGSSGGSAAAVAAGLGPLSIGGDGAGSVRIPASFCGVVGLKPSFGRVPVYPGPAANEAVLHAGPITRTVRDAALMLNVLAGAHPYDPLSLGTDRPDFLDGIGDGVAGMRVAWSADLGFLQPEPETARIAETAARTFEGLGAHLEQAPLTLVDPGWILDALWGGNLAGQHAGRPLAEKARMDPHLVAYAEARQGMLIGDYVKAVAARQTIANQLARLFEAFDLLLTPTVAVPAFPLGLVNPVHVNGRAVPHLGWSLTYPFNWSGQPAISVPAGWTQGGLPVGLQIVGPRLADARVLRAAAAFEQANPWAHRWPEFAG